MKELPIRFFCTPYKAILLLLKKEKEYKIDDFKKKREYSIFSRQKRVNTLKKSISGHPAFCTKTRRNQNKKRSFE